MRFAVVVFPGTWSDHDCQYSLANVMGQQAELVWHRESDLSRFDAIVLPGGFSYGDYLRTGAIARFSPVMEAVAKDAEAGKPVIGICNGFQVLCEAHLLPGALLRNDSLQYRCVWTNLRAENTSSAFTAALEPGQVLRVPISHGEGRYFADDKTLDALEKAEPRGVPLLRAGRRGNVGVEPERERPKHRRDRQRTRQCAGDDAAPGARLRASDGRRGRATDLEIGAGMGGRPGVMLLRRQRQA